METKSHLQGMETLFKSFTTSWNGSQVQLQMDLHVSGADRSALSCFSDTVRHSILVRNTLIYPDYSAEPLNQPNLISLTVNHLDVFFPVWLWIYTNERGGRRRKGNSRDGSGHGAGTRICKPIIYYHSRTWKKTHAGCTNHAPRAPLHTTCLTNTASDLKLRFIAPPACGKSRIYEELSQYQIIWLKISQNQSNSWAWITAHYHFNRDPNYISSITRIIFVFYNVSYK